MKYMSPDIQQLKQTVSSKREIYRMESTLNELKNLVIKETTSKSVEYAQWAKQPLQVRNVKV